MGRFLRYWYTYRTFVAVLLGISVSGLMYWLYVMQVAGDAGQPVAVNISVPPEDRIMAATEQPTDPNILIVGIDDKSVKHWPLPRSDYAALLKNLETAGAAVVAFDVEFHDSGVADITFQKALAAATIPVVLAYGGSSTLAGDGKYVQTGVDQYPLKAFRCGDANALTTADTPCQQPERRPAPEERPRKDRKAERDTTKEREPS